MQAQVRKATRILVTLAMSVGAIAAIWYGRDRVLVAREQIAFRSGELTLRGTLFRPRRVERPPAIVLVGGSGAEDRSGMFWFAKQFSRRGFAVLAYDKRGCGSSEGDSQAWRYFNLEELASDAAAAVRFVQADARVDSARVGIFAVSQGGWVAPLAATKNSQLAFMVILSASVCSIAEDRLFERQERLRLEGFNEQERAEVLAMHLIDNELTRSGERIDEFAALWQQNQSKRWFRRVYLGEQPMAPDHEYRQWERTVLDFDPVPILASLDLPIYWIFGDARLDRLGPVQLSMQRLEVLRAAGKAYEVHSFAGSDHNLVLQEGLASRLPWEVQAPWLEGMFGWLE